MEPSSEFRYPNIIEFFGTTLFHLCHFTQIDLHSYKAYDNYIESNLIKSNEILSERVRGVMSKSEESYHGDILNSFGQDFNDLQNIYPALHRKSMIITLYNFFEHQIKTLCEEINKLLPKNMTKIYLKDTCIKRYRKFLRIEASLNIWQGGTLWELWEDMIKVEQVRHVLVHSEGEVDTDKSKPLADIQNYCNRRKNIRLIGHKIIIDDNFVSTLISDLINLFELLDKQITAFIHRYENEHGCYHF